MKLTSILLGLGLFLGSSFALKENNIMADFLEDASSITEINATRPIKALQIVADVSATAKVNLTKENIGEVLEEAKSYKHLVIITGTHTIVKITDLEDCKQSGSWGTCMPKGEGYISKAGALSYYDDYLNNIIGIPGSQTRTAYFFD